MTIRMDVATVMEDALKIMTVGMSQVPARVSAPVPVSWVYAQQMSSYSDDDEDDFDVYDDDDDDEDDFFPDDDDEDDNLSSDDDEDF